MNNVGVKLLIDFTIGFACYSVAHISVMSGAPYFNPSPQEAMAGLHLALLYGLFGATASYINGIVRAPWRFVSMMDGMDVVRTALTTSAGFVLLAILARTFVSIPLAMLFISFVFHAAGMMLARLLARAVHEQALVRFVLPWPFSTHSPLKNSMIVAGPLVRVESYLRTMQRDDLAKTIVGAIVLEDGWTGQRLRGVQVLGQPGRLRDLVKSRSARIDGVLFVCEPSDVVDADTLAAMKSSGMSLLRLPRAEDLDSSSKSPAKPREIRLDDLLPRPPLRISPEPLIDMIAGKRVLITGAGGSIGAELVRQVSHLRPAQLTLVDNGEHNLFTIKTELENLQPLTNTQAVYCDVRDRARIQRVIETARPHLVFHAAALKHLPLMEGNPAEAALTNVVGTANVAHAAADAGVGAVVLVSTDKAVKPCNVMGTTKRLAEAVLHGLRDRSDGKTRSVIVRFGNVLGSSGSVVPLFKDQIRRGGPVQVTDPDVTRFFMTIPESVLLTLHATALALSKPPSRRNGVYVLEMGDPMKIVDLAKRMIAFYAPENRRDIEIVYTGLRPGEKLTEELIDDDESAYKSPTPGIMEVRADAPPRALHEPDIQHLAHLARNDSDEAVRDHLFDLLKRVRTHSVPAEELKTAPPGVSTGNKVVALSDTRRR